jgi:Fur family ferric uptake transcriptional regulator
LVDRLDSFGRLSYFGMAPNDHHRPHPHFFCKKCGRVDCLSPESLNVDTTSLWKTFPGQIDKVEVRVDGICRNCMA